MILNKIYQVIAVLALIVIFLGCKTIVYPKSRCIFISKFNSVPNGKTDNHSAFVMAIQEASKRQVHEIQLEEGIYTIGKSIIGINNIKFNGIPGKTIIKPTKGFKEFNLFWFNYSAIWTNISFTNITFDFTESPKVNAIRIDTERNNQHQSSELFISNCTFANLNSSIVANNIQIIATKNKFQNVKNAVLINKCINCKFISNTCSYSQNCFTFNDNNGNTNNNILISNNVLLYTTKYPIHFADVSIGFNNQITISKNIIIADTLKYQSSNTIGSADMISLFGSQNILINKNIISGGGDMGVTLQRCNNAVIKNNKITYNAKSGIVISSLGDKIPNYNNIIIKNNIITDNGQYPSGGHPASISGIYLEDNDHSGITVTIGKNTITNNSKTNPTQNM